MDISTMNTGVRRGLQQRVTARLAAALLLALGCTPALAATIEASVSLLPADSEVVSGDGFSIELFFDAGDAPGTLFGGEIIIDFDPLLLGYDGFTATDGVTLFSPETISFDNGRQLVQLGFENAGPSGAAGSFAFVALGSPGELATIGLADADDFFGTFTSLAPTIQPIAPQFTGASVTIVPLPAAGWLLLSALGVLVAGRRLAGPAARGRVASAE